MKSATSLTIALLLGALAAPVLIGANPKKPADAAPAANAAAPEADIPETVAVVEGVPIKKGELEERLNMMLSQQGMTVKDVPAQEKAEVFHRILDDLIVERLLDKHAAGEKVTDEEVAATLDRFSKRFGTVEEMQKQVAAHGQTMDQVKNDIRSSLRQEHWVDAQIKGKAEVTEGEAEDFYKKNPEKFKQPEEVRASHILVATPEDAKPEVVAEKQKQAQSIADRVKKGEDFDKLAEQLSEDPSAKENKGDLGFFAKEQMVPEFANAAFAMKKGEISNPVQSKFGFHIIKLTDRKEAGTVTLDEAKPQLLAQLKRQKEEEETTKILKALRDSADVKVNLPPLPAAPPEPPAATGPAAAAPAPTTKTK